MLSKMEFEVLIRVLNEVLDKSFFYVILFYLYGCSDLGNYFNEKC